MSETCKATFPLGNELSWLLANGVVKVRGPIAARVNTNVNHFFIFVEKKINLVDELLPLLLPYHNFSLYPKILFLLKYFYLELSEIKEFLDLIRVC